MDTNFWRDQLYLLIGYGLIGCMVRGLAVVVGLLPEFDGLVALGATAILRLFAIAYVAFAP